VYYSMYWEVLKRQGYASKCKTTLEIKICEFDKSS
jgi:hypothetical protein